MKKLAYYSLSAMLLLLSGCGGGSDEASCRFEVQQNLDTGNYAAVIAELSNENSACRGAYLNNEFQIDLGAAYMGEAGLSLSDVIGIIGVEDSAGNSSYGTFVDSVSKKQTNTALTSLEKSGDAFTSALNGTECDVVSLSSSEKDICLYLGLAQTMRATTTISYLLDDVTAFFDGNAAAKDQMKASMCALQFANDSTTCSNASSVTETPVTFTYSNGSTKDFRDIKVVINGTDYYRLANTETTVVTDGYCTNAFATPSSAWATGLYACPLNKDPLQEDLNVSTLLVDTLNDGLDAVSGALSGDPELQQDINDYKNDIDDHGNSDGIIDLNEIQAYLLTL